MTYYCEPTGGKSATFYINDKPICGFVKTPFGYESHFQHSFHRFDFLRQNIQHAIAKYKGWIK